MATDKGWLIDSSGSIAGDFTEDVEEFDLVTAAFAICGSGERAAGCVDRDIDISVNARGEYHTKGRMVALCAAAITDLDVPIKPAADGKVTPATTDKDFCVGFPKNLQATVGGKVEFEWRPLYYAV